METRKKQSGLGIVAFVLGIIGMLTTCIVIGILPCIVGLALSIVVICSKNSKKGLAIAGLVCSVIGIFIFSLFVYWANSNEDIEDLGSGKVVVEETASTPEPTVAPTSTPSPKPTETPAPTPAPTPTPTPTPTTTPTTTPVPEILFCNIPWGTSFSVVDEELGELGLWGISGENYKTMSVDDIILGDYHGIDFEYSDINIIGNAYNGEIDVAGYTTSEVKLYFAFIPVNGILTKEDDASALYGAQYVFQPKNLNQMESDLIEKLTSLYGEPSKTASDSDIWGIKYYYTYWYGGNSTQVVLKKTDASNDSTNLYNDEIVISYVWTEGDELLQNASDILKKEAEKKEADSYGNGKTNGL